MAKLTCSRDYVGAKTDPETGEDIQMGADVPIEVAERLANEYKRVSIVESDDPECGVNGCSRDVDDPSSTCWQH